MVAKLPKAYLGGPAVYESAHSRLRALGEQYLSAR
jgi:hypothetical protein